jgi:hypothetical protein
MRHELEADDVDDDPMAQPISSTPAKIRTSHANPHLFSRMMRPSPSTFGKREAVLTP